MLRMRLLIGVVQLAFCVERIISASASVLLFSRYFPTCTFTVSFSIFPFFLLPCITIEPLSRRSLQVPKAMLSCKGVLLMRHIGQDVPRRHTHFVLESRLMYEKSFRDEWLRSLCQALANVDEPLAKSLSGLPQQMLQRKVTCFSYNQFGLFKIPYHRLANVDRYHAVQGTLGTREWVPYANISYWTMNKMVRSGNILVHRVHYKGWGTDKTLNQGGWVHRWNKVMQRNALQYNRI